MTTPSESNYPLASIITGIGILVGLSVGAYHNSQTNAVGVTHREHTEPRSPHWPKARADWLAIHGECEACGQKDNLNVHHVVPFHDNPALELDPTNFVTLCTDGIGHTNCHLMIGHAGNFKCHNPNVREDAKAFRKMLTTNKVCDN